MTYPFSDSEIRRVRVRVNILVLIEKVLLTIDKSILLGFSNSAGGFV